ncbi:hypothetical protein O1611_g4406 [Lasiodiplodia mahajangana]|uniref:Uncharacterized protein n=1 Tax=Lasiodiplodia mahajangana TaxID=1108764 RepID=A0ACC2JPF3_9PEZI|nr:hypothetical protein O1611_g4406 [Lasiodiplodia mahajangana]
MPNFQQQTGAFGLASTVIVANPKFQTYQWRTLRISTFVAMGLSAILPMIHAASIYPYAQLHERTGIGDYLLEGLAVVVGTVFYTVRNSLIT